MKPIFTLCLVAMTCSCLSTPQEGIPPTPSGLSDSGVPSAAHAPSGAPADGQHDRYARPPPAAAAAARGWSPPEAQPPAAIERGKAPAATPEPEAQWQKGSTSLGAAGSPGPAKKTAEAPMGLGASSATSAPSAPATSLRDDATARLGAEAPARRTTTHGGDGAATDSPRSLAELEPAKDRPGLGTSWGESRHSSVTEVPFVRDSSTPAYTTTMHYNDERGAAALTGRGSGLYTATANIGLGAALTLSLRNESGTPLSAYRGGGRLVAIGERGQRYTIVVQNNTNERFEVVLSVDGLDVIDGRDAGYGKRGYLIEAAGILEVDGFRQSDETVAAFRFGAVGDSYAAQTGSARNVGVIGVAAFGERGYTARLRAYLDRMEALRLSGVEAERRMAADPFPNKYATPPLQMVH